MRKTRIYFLICMSLGMLSISCRDTDNAKDLNSQEDGTRQINTTELEEVSRRESSDTTDVMIDERDTYEDGIYRESDVHREHDENLDQMQGQNSNRSGNQNRTNNP